MTNSYIQTYLEQAKLCFPILGKPERQYLEQFAAMVKARFSEEEPDSMEALVQAFGSPQSVVKDYLNSTDATQVARRACVQKYRTICLSVLAYLALMAAVVVTCFGLVILRIQNKELQYEWPTYTISEVPPELMPSEEDLEALP
jgi:uncharacterized membrane protein